MTEESAENTHPQEPQAGKVLTGLSELPDDALLNAPALAQAMGKSTRTVKRMIGRGELPRGILLGGEKKWRAGTVRRYLQDRFERAADESRRIQVNLAQRS